MDQNFNQQKPKKKSHLLNILISLLLIILISGWVVFTRAGYIPNYLNIDLLCPKKQSPTPGFFPRGGGNPNMDYKPVIYLYPETQKKVEVKINYKGQFTATYPEYKDGWNVIASPDGKIVNLPDGKEYSYLFWEGIDDEASYDLSTGFVVKGSEAAQFLQSKLAEMGLTPKEYNEFIVYWLPKMIGNEYNLIHFATAEEYDNRAALNIEPKPNSVLRIFMVFKKLDHSVELKPQVTNNFERNGFTVIEWGGTKVK